MRTRAQMSRDAALRRLNNVNRSLTVAAVIGAGVITDVVANTASGHTRSASDTSANAFAGYKPALLVTPGSSSSSARTAAAARHRAAEARRRAEARKTRDAESLQGSSASSSVTPSQSSSSSSGSSSSSSSSTSSVSSSSANVAPAASSAPTVVAVSGGS